MMSMDREWPMDSKLRRQQVQRGQTLAELAVVTPILVIIVVGILDFGRVLMVQHTITSVARQSARLATMTNSVESLYSKINASLESRGLHPGAATINVTGLTGASGEPTQVTISYHVRPLILRLLHVERSFTIGAASRMRRE